MDVCVRMADQRLGCASEAVRERAMWCAKVKEYAKLRRRRTKQTKHHWQIDGERGAVAML